MLYPQMNRCRTVIDLSGFWEIKVDPENRGEPEQWMNGFEPDALIAVPGSWNEQLAELGLMNYIGKIWYQKQFQIPQALANHQLYIRFGSADHHARVWLNGEFLGEHFGGYLPFEFDMSAHIKKNQPNLLVVSVDNTLTHDTIPQGVTAEDYQAFHRQRYQTFPPTVFDFFPYGGIHRPVKIIALQPHHIEYVRIQTNIIGNKGLINFQVQFSGQAESTQLKITIWDRQRKLLETNYGLQENLLEGALEIPDCQFWSHEHPFLYRMQLELFENAKLIDEYELEVGVREIEVTEQGLLINGQPLFLKGFGKHEDFAVIGKGLLPPLIVKDFQLMKWIGANSFRTSHYPYAEEILQMADRLGFYVIAETPAVSLNFSFANQKTLDSHRRALIELIQRDQNHPSVIAWSLANEPGIWGEPEANAEQADQYWAELFALAKKLDPTRPLTLPTFPRWKDKDVVYKYCDFVSINRYWGWYEIPGEIDRAGEVLREELIQLFERYHKPILVSEFGADTVEGLHATYPQLFTEEYQTDLIQKYFDIIESLPFAIGEHIWNFADFRTAQHFRRVVLNKKGVFNRQREPKAAAFFIREHWNRK
ncbi:MAG: beta-glucuronidase [candidate division KSB1 bacterium]|nr:beta-glucuronidase [candidate division KSB1 bacterium]